MMFRIFVFILFLKVAIFASVATVVDKVGSATLQRAGKTVPLELKAELEEHDTIQTEKNAKVKIFFRDNTAVSLGQNTSFSIDSYLFDNSAKSDVKFGVVKGFFKTVTGRIGKVAPNRFKLKTKNATIGIRGTVFAAQVSQKEDVIICTEGLIEVKNSFGTFEVAAGREAQFYSSRKPTVRSYTEAQKLAILKKSGWKGSKNIKELIAYIKANFKEPLRGELLATVQNILNKDSDSRKEYLEKGKGVKTTIENADDIGFVDDIKINGREFDSLDDRVIEFYKDDLIDGKVIVDGILESDDDKTSVKELFVEISVDGGDTWTRAKGHEEWQWSFTPELQKEYEFALRVVKEKKSFPKKLQKSTLPITIAGAKNQDFDININAQESAQTKVITTEPLVVKFKKYRSKVITTEPLVVKFKKYRPKVITTEPLVVKFKKYRPKVITTEPLVVKFKKYRPKVITTEPLVVKFKKSMSSANSKKVTPQMQKYSGAVAATLAAKEESLSKRDATSEIKQNEHKPTRLHFETTTGTIKLKLKKPAVFEATTAALKLKLKKPAVFEATTAALKLKLKKPAVFEATTDTIKLKLNSN